MKKLDVQEYADLIGKSKTAVYNSINENKVKYIVDSVNGRVVKKVLIEDQEYEDLLSRSSLNQVEDLNIDKIIQVESTTLKQPQEVIKQDIVFELVNQVKESHCRLNELQHKLVIYAELAGQAKLLTDSESRTKTQFFELVQENKQLNRVNAELSTKLDMFQEKLQGQENLQQLQESLIQEKTELKTKLEALQEKLKQAEEKRYNITDWLKRL